MNSWQDLIAQWGGAGKFADDIGITRDAGYQMKSRNSVHSDYWPLIVARAPRAGLQGITMEFLATLRKGHKGRRAGRFHEARVA